VIEALRPLGIELRAGIHTGECELHEGKVAGVALSIGSRICAAAGTGEVLVSRTVRDLVAGSCIEFDERGRHGSRVSDNGGSTPSPDDYGPTIEEVDSGCGREQGTG
jgi:class 3 adenylate cyclase